MLVLRLSKNVCALIAFGTVLCGPFLAMDGDEATFPLYVATMFSSAFGFIVFDREYRKARQELENNE